MSCYLCGDTRRALQLRAVGKVAEISVCLSCSDRWKLVTPQVRKAGQERAAYAATPEPTTDPAYYPPRRSYGY